MKFKTINPTTGEPLAEYDMATSEEVNAAVEKARKAFGDWRKLKPAERGKYLAKAHRLQSVVFDKTGTLTESLLLDFTAPADE